MKETGRGWIIGIAAGCALVLGAGLGITAYQRENQFQPVSADRDIQINQVVFSQDENGAGYEKEKSGSEGEIWQKDHETEEKNRPGIQEGADYLYEDGKLKETDPAGGILNQDDQKSTADLIGNWNGEGDNAGSGNAAYELTGDLAHADLVISGSGAGVEAGSAGSGNAGSSSSDSENGSAETGNSGWADSGNNADAGKPSPSGDPSPLPSGVPVPSAKPADTVKDPAADVSNKTDASDIGSVDSDIISNYDENKFKGTEETNYDQVVIARPWLGTSFIYLGQSIDQRTIFNSLDTYVKGSDGKMYFWGSDALDKYIRIDSVSLDGGENWITEFPVTIPTNMAKSDFIVKASYRFSESGKWMEKEIPYELEEGCLYVLKNALTDGNGVLQKENILNDEKYPQAGENVILYQYQRKLLDAENDSYLFELFPGWEENGKAVSWFYQAGYGRHILEPMEMIPLDSVYTVKLKLMWMNDDGQVGDGLAYSNLVYLQTLTEFMEGAKTFQRSYGLFGESKGTLTVPDYVQAVELEDDPWGFYGRASETDYLQIPESVLYVDLSNSTFKVNNGYLVDQDNPYYETEMGMLVNKEKTEILGIPYNMKKVTIPDTYQKVNVAGDNQIGEIILTADSKDRLPEISYENLENCKITIKDQLLQDFLSDNYESIFLNDGNEVVLQNTGTAYLVKKDAIVSTDGELYKVIDTAGKEITLAREVKKIGEEAFGEQPGIQKLILDENGGTVELSENCFKNSGIEVIFCYSKEQYDSVTAQLDEGKTGKAADTITVQYLQKSKEGHEYFIDSKDGEITLIRAAKETTSFEGTITDESGNLLTVTEIGDNAFADCSQLVWVSLPEAVHRIGYQAFKNCSSLEGVFSEITTKIVIGNKAFDGCGSLQFIAFNAVQAEMQNNYDPNVTDGHMFTFYAPPGSYGYGSYAVCFESGVDGYHLIKAGDKGRLLYGYDEDGDWLLLKGIGEMASHISLQANTLEVYYYAMEGTRAESGSYYQIDNLGDMEKIYLDRGAFKDSALGGAVTLGETVVQSSEHDFVFENCSEITEISMESINVIPICFFTGCKNLQKLTLNSTTPPDLTIYPRMKYQFFGWNEDDLEAQFSLSVPSGSEETYIRAWRYLTAGYADIYNDTAYISWWRDVQETLLFENWEMPSDEKVDERLKSEMLQAENRLRNMMGIDETGEPIDYYPYHIDDDGMITLVGVPKDCTELDLSDVEKMGMPRGWAIDYIGAGVFKGSSLKQVTVPDTLVGLQSGFLDGVDHTITLNFEKREKKDPPELMGWTREEPFTFGNGASYVTIQVPEGEEEDYIEMWSYPMAGYQSQAQMRTLLPQELMEQTGHEPTDEEIEQAMAEKLLDPVNSLRSMMELDEVTIEDILKDMLSVSSEDKEEIPDEDDKDQMKETDPEDQTDPDAGEDAEEQDPDKDASDNENSQDTEDGDSENNDTGNNSGKEDADSSGNAGEENGNSSGQDGAKEDESSGASDAEENKGSSSAGSEKDAGDKTGSKDTGSTEEEIPA